MKKIYISILSVLIFSACAYALTADPNVRYSKVFSVRIVKCLQTTLHQTVTNDDGTVSNITRIIGGRKDNMCRYSEVEETGEEIKKMKCLFTRGQMVALSHAMLADPEGKGVAKDLWSDYTNDVNICEMEN